MGILSLNRKKHDRSAVLPHNDANNYNCDQFTFNKHALSAFYVPDTFLIAEDKKKKQDMISDLKELSDI